MSPLDAITEALRDRGQVQLAVVFGSWARGKARAGSDVDIGIRLSPDSAAARRRFELELTRAARCPVDVIYLDEAPPQLRFEIARDGVLLLEREPSGWADFRAKAMIDWWDWAPTARLIHRAAVARLRAKVTHGPA